jgi:hypothetical protein
MPGGHKHGYDADSEVLVTSALLGVMGLVCLVGVLERFGLF